MLPPMLPRENHEADEAPNQGSTGISMPKLQFITNMAEPQLGPAQSYVEHVSFCPFLKYEPPSDIRRLFALTSSFNRPKAHHLLSFRECR